MTGRCCSYILINFRNEDTGKEVVEKRGGSTACANLSGVSELIFTVLMLLSMCVTLTLLSFCTFYTAGAHAGLCCLRGGILTSFSFPKPFGTFRIRRFAQNNAPLYYDTRTRQKVVFFAHPDWNARVLCVTSSCLDLRLLG